MRRILLCLGDPPESISPSRADQLADFIHHLCSRLGAFPDLVFLFGGRKETIAESVVAGLKRTLSPGTFARAVHTYVPKRHELSELPELEYVKYGVVVHAGVLPEQRREELVRDSDLLILMGTGRGIHEMARIARLFGRFIIPVPFCAGPALDVHAELMRRSTLSTDLRDLLSRIGDHDASGEAIAIAVADAVDAYLRGIVGGAQVFLAMPLIPEFREGAAALRMAVNVCRRHGLTLYVSRDTSGQQPVITDLLEQIASSAVLIAYLDHSRANVYLEVGYAWGKGKPVVLCIRDTDTVAFDARAHECIRWQSTRELGRKLDKRIARLIQERYIVAASSAGI